MPMREWQRDRRNDRVYIISVFRRFELWACGVPKEIKHQKSNQQKSMSRPEHKLLLASVFCDLRYGSPWNKPLSMWPQKEIKPRDSLVPIKCYIPAGTDCSWYKECLETRIACESTNERYAITYAEKYCKLYNDRYARFSDKGKVWIDAVRKCLQESLAYVMYPQSDVTCQSVKETAFLSHINCYRNPEPGISFCDLSLRDQFRVFWTIKGALLEEFTKTVSSGWSVL